MKFGVLLLALFTFLLSVKLGIAPLITAATKTDACCKSKTDQPSKDRSALPLQQNDNGCGELCNPFQPCCPYITMAMGKSIISSPSVFSSQTKGFPLYHISFFSSYSPDFWQPPKMV